MRRRCAASSSRRPAGRSRSSRPGGGPSIRRPAASLTSDRQQLRRGVEVADEQQILEQRRPPASSARPSARRPARCAADRGPASRSSARSAVVAIVPSHALDPLGRIVADAARRRSPASARPTARGRTRRRRTTRPSTTSAASRATWFQTVSKPSVLPSGDAATSSCASDSSRCCCSGVADQRLERLRERDRSASSRAMTLTRDERARSSSSVMRLTTACTSRAPFVGRPRVSQQPEQHLRRAAGRRPRPCSAAPARARSGCVFRHDVDDAAQHAHERRRSSRRCRRPRRRLLSSVAISSAQLVAVAGDAEQLADRLPRRDRRRCPAGSW